MVKSVASIFDHRLCLGCTISCIAIALFFLGQKVLGAAVLVSIGQLSGLSCTEAIVVRARGCATCWQLYRCDMPDQAWDGTAGHLPTPLPQRKHMPMHRLAIGLRG